MTLTSTVLPDSASNKIVTWSSSNPDIAKVSSNGVATVSSDGLITGIADGTANIIVTTIDGSKKDTCAITVSSTGPYDPVVTTTAISAFKQTTASGGGNVTDDGGASVTARGVCTHRVFCFGY